MVKKKILFFTENLYGGGVERISQIILSHFNYNKYDVILYSLCEYEYDPQIFSSKIKYKYIYDTIKKNDLAISKVYKLLKNKIKLLIYTYFSPKLFYTLFVNEKVDIAIAFIEGYATRIISGAPNHIRKIGWIHTDLLNNHWTKVSYKDDSEEIKCYGNFNHIVCVSKIIKEHSNSYLKKCCNYSIIYNPIDKESILKQSTEYINPIISKRIKIATLGSLVKVKGYDRLINVISKLRKDFNIELTIYGQGKEKQELELLSKKLNIQEYVKFAGFKENPFPYIKQADVYVCSSYAEGFNTAITEALVLGKPIVSTECSGVKEQLGDNNEWGICCENSEEGLYNGLKIMLSGNNIDYYSKQANIRGKEFSLETSMNDIYKILEQ